MRRTSIRFVAEVGPGRVCKECAFVKFEKPAHAVLQSDAMKIRTSIANVQGRKFPRLSQVVHQRQYYIHTGSLTAVA